MARYLVANRVLPPGGRVCCAGLAGQDVAYTGAAQETAGLASEDTAADEAAVSVEQHVSVLECSEGDHLDGWLAEVIGQNCRELRTKGDGACAMHATFGWGDPTRHELRCEHPRRVLRAVLAQPLEIIRLRVRPGQMELVDAVVSSLWTDFVVPHVREELHLPTRSVCF